MSKNIKNLHVLPVAISDDGRHVAVVNDRHFLELHQTTDEDSLLRSIPLHDEVKGQLRFLQWSKTGCASNGQTTCAQRVLCASSTHVSVFDAADENWVAEIDAGDGTTFVHVDFTPSPDEVICFFEFNVQLMISSLKTGEQRVIRTPKFSGSNGYAFRPKSGHLALLLKIEGNDVLSIHEPQTYECITTAALQIVDVQGLKWSPNGAWIAVWGAALVGTAVAIYTADGQYFRTYTGAENEIGFGVKTIEWSPDSRVLALGKQGGSVELINGQTFKLAMVLGDPMSVPIGRDVYTENNSAITEREYTLAPESPLFPFTYSVAPETRTISAISFNPTGTMAATIDQSLPHIVWMWLIQESIPRLAGALVQKSSVKQLIWNNNNPELLMTTNDDDVATVHQWICGRQPRIVRIPHVGGGKYSASWIKAGDTDADGLVWFGWSAGYIMGYPLGAGSSAEFRQVRSVEEECCSLLSSGDFPCT